MKNATVPPSSRFHRIRHLRRRPDLVRTLATAILLLTAGAFAFAQTKPAGVAPPTPDARPAQPGVGAPPATQPQTPGPVPPATTTTPATTPAAATTTPAAAAQPQ